MHAPGDIIAALATARGQSAIGVIRLSGPGSIALVNAVFKGKNLEAQAPNTLHFGRIYDEEGILDEVVVSLFHAPHSYTGEEIVEISGHGSPWMLDRMLQLFVRKGARMAGPGEFTLRAFLNGKLDLSQAEAVADLIASDSKAAHRLAMEQMRGGFSKRINALRDELIHFVSLIELELDFGEEDVEFADKAALRELLLQVRITVNELLHSYRDGRVLKEGVPTVIAGKPNAGKSTLLNALLNEERAIVSDIAGTTRDTIEESLLIHGVQFRLMDTAGLREHTTDVIEQMGIDRTLERIQQARLVLYLFDVQHTDAKSLKEELAQIDREGIERIVVGNKVDQKENEAAYLEAFSGINNLVLISAATGRIQPLLESLSQLADKLNQQSGISVTNSRHYQALFQASEHLERALNGLDNGITGDFLAMDIRQALHLLAEITGQISTEEILGSIFGRFCIGK